ncbi:MAG: hypothetical protein KKD38_06650 [Candidatus Delongbacteria bacterium]|nr:hypothetical protein [Candidatus Delongbacteria bacterium]MCG2759613.1 hypothetical protein [Candidatus Delongbacteria bacterium]
MKNSLTLILIFIFSFSYCQSERDSIYFQYSDFDAYKILSSNLNLSGSDSLSRFNLSGSNSKTMYEKYSKNDFGIKGDLSIINNSYEFGCLLSTNHISNSSLTHPTFNDIQIMPSFGYNSKYFDIQTAFGYISKVDEVSQKQGQNLSLKGNMIC